MTQYTKKSFSVTAPGSQQYRDNWERTFRGPKEKRCIYCDQLKTPALNKVCPNRPRTRTHEFSERVA